MDATPVLAAKLSFTSPKLSTHPYQSSTSTDKAQVPNMEYLWKNVNMTCSDQDQILDFYICLRLAVAKGGIYMKQIEDITKGSSIAQVDSMANTQTIQIQSNALYLLFYLMKNLFPMIL